MLVIFLTIIRLMIGNTIIKKKLLLRVIFVFALMIALRDQYCFKKNNNIIFDIRSVSRFSYYRDGYINVRRNSIIFFD